MKTSVIIANYNNGKYLSDCIKSVQGETCDIEIVIIDDASTDDSVKIIEMFAVSDPRIKFARQPINRGASAARNVGIEMATGDYIMFIDVDDILNTGAIAEMMNLARSLNMPEIVIADYQLIPENFNIAQILPINFAINKFQTIDNDYIKVLNKITTMNRAVVWGKLYSRNIIADIKFDETLHQYEDTLFNLSVIKNVKRGVISDNICVLYRKSETSITQFDNGASIDSMLYMSEKLIEDIKEILRNKDEKNLAFTKYLVIFIYWCIRAYINKNMPDFPKNKEYMDKISSFLRTTNGKMVMNSLRLRLGRALGLRLFARGFYNLGWKFIRDPQDKYAKYDTY
jgi:glycosyltransferase involved in cell wall biosynthesis